MNAIETYQLTKVYDKPQGWSRLGRSAPVTAVSDLNFSVPKGELFGLLGPNGAGKTTLVKMLCTLILPSSGSGEVAGRPLTDAGKIRASVGLVVSDDRSFYWRLSARRNLDFFAAMHGLHGRGAEARIQQVLADVELLAVAEQRFGTLSSGMRQRLAIARSLLHQPQLLFLDEPSRSLDPKATQRLHDLIRQLMARKEMTVFLITHDLAEAEALADRLALMHQGQIKALGTPAELRRHLYKAVRYTLQIDTLPTAVKQSLSNFPNLTIHEPNQLHLRAVHGDGRLTAVFDILRQNNLTIQHVESAAPSLEEVFNHFTQGDG
jgi:ABC-2 type transport system ATP-binding protein